MKALGLCIQQRVPLPDSRGPRVPSHPPSLPMGPTPRQAHGEPAWGEDQDLELNASDSLCTQTNNVALLLWETLVTHTHLSTMPGLGWVV